MTQDTELEEDKDVVVSEEEETLNYTRNIRKKIIAKAFAEEKLPADRIEAQLLMDSLNSLERTSLTKMRIKSDKENSKNLGSLAVELAKHMAENVSHKRPETPVREEIPVPKSDLLDGFEIPEFELEKDIKQMDYKEFKEAL